MVINMKSVKAGECKVCGHTFDTGYPVKLNVTTKSMECQSHPEYLISVESIETTEEERKTLKSDVGFTVLVTAPKSKNHGNVINITERVFNPRYNSYFFTGYNSATGEAANLGEDTRCIVIFKTIKTEKLNPHFVAA